VHKSTLACLLLSFTASSCTTGFERFESLQDDVRTELTRLYPPGQPYWTTEYRCSVERWNLSKDPPSRFAGFLHECVSRSHDSAAGCWIAEIPRWPSPWPDEWRNSTRYTSSLHVPLGFWIDYVFVDSEERILAAYRKLID